MRAGRAGLRALQGRRELEKLVRQVKATRDAMPWGAAGDFLTVMPQVLSLFQVSACLMLLRAGFDR
jgi:dihydroorotate dehydrogenase